MDDRHASQSRVWGSMGFPPELAAIFGDHFGEVWITLRHLGVLESDREDLVHEVFFDVLARPHEYDPTRPLRPWVVDRPRRDKRPAPRSGEVEVLGTSSDASADDVPADECLVALEERKRLRQSLHILARTRREGFTMYYLEEMCVPRIAYVLDIPIEIAYSRARLAREALANVVTRLHIARGVP